MPSYFPRRNENIHPHKDLYLNVYAVLFIVAPNFKQPNCLSAGERKQTVRLPWSYYYSAVKLIELLMHVTTWINLKCILLRENKSHSRKSSYCIVLLICSSGKGKITVPYVEDQTLETGGRDYLSRDMREL